MRRSEEKGWSRATTKQSYGCVRDGLSFGVKDNRTHQTPRDETALRGRLKLAPSSQETREGGVVERMGVSALRPFTRSGQAFDVP